jgi:hypothetical protein
MQHLFERGSTGKFAAAQLTLKTGAVEGLLRVGHGDIGGVEFPLADCANFEV